jgi:hypothetical protein
MAAQARRQRGSVGLNDVTSLKRVIIGLSSVAYYTVDVFGSVKPEGRLPYQLTLRQRQRLWQRGWVSRVSQWVGDLVWHTEGWAGHRAASGGSVAR